MKPRELVRAQRAIRPPQERSRGAASELRRLQGTAAAARLAAAPVVVPVVVVLASRAERLPRPPSADLRLDRALCALVALLAAAALCYGLCVDDNGLAGCALSALVAAAWAASVLSDRATLTRSREIRAAIERASRARGRNP